MFSTDLLRSFCVEMRSQRDAARVLVDGEETVPVAPCDGVADLGAWGEGGRS